MKVGPLGGVSLGAQLLIQLGHRLVEGVGKILFLLGKRLFGGLSQAVVQDFGELHVAQPVVAAAQELDFQFSLGHHGSALWPP